MRLETASTEFAEAAGTRFAYRKLGPADGTPPVCLQHFALVSPQGEILAGPVTFEIKGAP